MYVYSAITAFSPSVGSRTPDRSDLIALRKRSPATFPSLVTSPDGETSVMECAPYSPLASASQALMNAQPTELDSPQLGARFEIQTLVRPSPWKFQSCSLNQPNPQLPWMRADTAWFDDLMQLLSSQPRSLAFV